MKNKTTSKSIHQSVVDEFLASLTKNKTDQEVIVRLQELLNKKQNPSISEIKAAIFKEEAQTT